MKKVIGKFITETKKAVLVQLKGTKEQKWFPKSVMKIQKKTKTGVIHFDLPTWFLAKNNIAA
ncbi:hypothetical protein N8508_00260 [bacterium]|nr:hypothetical protein [bacterium]